MGKKNHQIAILGDNLTKIQAENLCDSFDKIKNKYFPKARLIFFEGMKDEKKKIPDVINITKKITNGN
jgi:hypothetical protein